MFISNINLSLCKKTNQPKLNELEIIKEHNEEYEQNEQNELNNEVCDNLLESNYLECNESIKQDSKKNSENNLENNSENDPWDISINDDKFYINNKIARIFPVLKNFSNYSKIKIDDESFSFITIREIADITSKIICYHLLEYNLNPQKIKIVDYTSGVGGNVLSFSKYFKYVYAVEISKQRAEYLENNIGVYGFKNIQVINMCAIEFNSTKLIEINPSVIFMDPPWGGSNYKSNDNLLLSLGSVPVEELVINITSQFDLLYKQIIEKNPDEKVNNSNNKFIILKLPKNYDIEHLYKYIRTRDNFENYYIYSYLYILNKMLIVVCELKFRDLF